MVGKIENNIFPEQIKNLNSNSGPGAPPLLRGRHRAPGQVRHQHGVGHGLDRPAGLQAQEPGGPGGSQGKGGMGEARGESLSILNQSILILDSHFHENSQMRTRMILHLILILFHF